MFAVLSSENLPAGEADRNVLFRALQLSGGCMQDTALDHGSLAEKASSCVESETTSLQPRGCSSKQACQLCAPGAEVSMRDGTSSMYNVFSKFSWNLLLLLQARRFSKFRRIIIKVHCVCRGSDLWLVVCASLH